ncbi:sialidase family protein [Flavobacterium sp. LC2016-12]|uniref:sialidase family protein n=1 Tax=Flavobacterium sp. LC2016-12 TaxID=2783794 RepID=UPI00188AA239|nr:sialidase family protein [Flavobacterium sp. LC2016-12]MBF4465682.1 exo-alpha-sialidase [Flavobacterium sp. LC2016-12]
MSLKFWCGMLLLFVLFSCGTDDEETPENVTINMLTDSNPVSNSVNYSTILKGGFLSRQYTFASTVRLDDNSLYMAGVSWAYFSDFNTDTNIIGVKSFDNGVSWSKPVVLQENIASVNVANPSLVKITDQHLLLFFASKESTRNINLYFKESFDQGKSWGTPKMINQPNSGYYIMNNDRVVYKNNRLWIPVAVPNGDIFKSYDSQKVFCFYSDNLGLTWEKTRTISKKYALMEPGLTVLSNKELLLNIRTKKGTVLFARSYDNGINWNFEYSNIKSPAAPQTIINKNKSDTLFMAWNHTDLNYAKSEGNRSPLSIAYSPDKGHNWKFIADIETAGEFSFSYPSMLLDKNDVYLNYYEMNNTSKKVSIKMAKIDLKF